MTAVAVRGWPASASSVLGAAAKTPILPLSRPPSPPALVTNVTMFDEQGVASRGHGLPRASLEAQAVALGPSLVMGATRWGAYAETSTDAVRRLCDVGVKAAVFGDVDGRWVLRSWAHLT